MPTGSLTSFGQYHSTEPIENFGLLHQHQGATLRVVDHEPKLAVLDQEDLLAQGIDASALVAGAARVDALGSCTANAAAVGISNLGMSNYDPFVGKTLGYVGTSSFDDALTGEKAAIVFYHDESVWPTGGDNGSTGPKIVSALVKLGVVKSQRIAHGAQDLVSLLQADGVLEGGPFLNAWMTPGAGNVVDGNGSASELESQIRSGVAGGHETYISAIEKLTLSATGLVEPSKTILRIRNSWSKSWGDDGSFRLHLSTLVALGRYFDFRQLVA